MKVRVVPSPDLPPDHYLPGIGPDGADVPADVAEDLIARGLAKKAPQKKAEPKPAQAEE